MQIMHIFTVELVISFILLSSECGKPLLGVLGDHCTVNEDCVEAMEHTVCQVEGNISQNEAPGGGWKGVCECEDGYRVNDSSSCRLC